MEEKLIVVQDLYQPGELGSPPDIEANICPIESSTNGQVIIDGSIM